MFNGPEYNPERDFVRLIGQTRRVFDAIKDGRWRTIADISALSGAPENSASAQLRHLRKKRFGSHIIQRRHLGKGLYVYRYGGKRDARKGS